MTSDQAARIITYDWEKGKTRMCVDGDPSSIRDITHGDRRSCKHLKKGDVVYMEDSCTDFRPNTKSFNISRPDTEQEGEEFLKNVREVTGNPAIIVPKEETGRYLELVEINHPELVKGLSQEKLKALYDTVAIYYMARTGIFDNCIAGKRPSGSPRKAKSRSDMTALKSLVKEISEAGASLKTAGGRRYDAHDRLGAIPSTAQKVLDALNSIIKETTEGIAAADGCDEEEVKRLRRRHANAEHAIEIMFKTTGSGELTTSKDGCATSTGEVILLSLMNDDGSWNGNGFEKTWKWALGNNLFRGNGNGLAHSRQWYNGFKAYIKVHFKEFEEEFYRRGGESKDLPKEWATYEGEKLKFEAAKDAWEKENPGKKYGKKFSHKRGYLCNTRVKTLARQVFVEVLRDGFTDACELGVKMTIKVLRTAEEA